MLILLWTNNTAALLLDVMLAVMWTNINTVPEVMRVLVWTMWCRWDKLLLSNRWLYDDTNGWWRNSLFSKSCIHHNLYFFIITFGAVLVFVHIRGTLVFVHTKTTKTSGGVLVLAHTNNVISRVSMTFVHSKTNVTSIHTSTNIPSLKWSGINAHQYLQYQRAALAFVYTTFNNCQTVWLSKM